MKPLEQDFLDEGAKRTGNSRQSRAEIDSRPSHRLRDRSRRIPVAHRAHHVAMSGVFREAEQPQTEQDEVNLHEVSSSS